MTLLRDWPLFGLRVQTPRISLSHPTDADLEVLNAVIDEGIHDPAWMPFDIPWTDDPPDIRPRRSLQHWWRLRAEWHPDKWTLTMMVKEGETVVGVQDMFGTDFALRLAEVRSRAARLPSPDEIKALEAAALAKPRVAMTPAEIRAVAAEAIAHLHETADKLAELSALLGEDQAVDQPEDKP